jgi:hypothetical protein
VGKSKRQPHRPQGELDALTDLVEKHLAWWRDEADEFNAKLEGLAIQAIAARRDRVRRIHDAAAQSGIPIAAGGAGAKTYITDTIKRKPSPVAPARLGTPMPLEPELANSVYEHILSVLRDACLQMERTPASYTTLHEEARRDVLLTTLNSHYRAVTGEAFNYQGKTDILVRVEDANVFVCECKFWDGSKLFAEACGVRYTRFAKGQGRHGLGEVQVRDLS